MTSFTRQEQSLFCFTALLLSFGFIGHWVFPLTPDTVRTIVSALGLAANVGSNHFVDIRTWIGISNAADVLSNLPFALFGVYGLFKLSKVCTDWKQLLHPEHFALTLFFLGLVLTCAGSSIYHLAPSDATLLWDRAGMALVFSGILGIAAFERVSARSALWLGSVVLVAGILSLIIWARTADVLAWTILQFGGMALVLILARMKRLPGSLGISLLSIITFYLFAKLCESLDHEIFQSTGNWVSGHTLKHLIASLAALPVLKALK